nr:MAG TPA: hypothetical protein [Bacteriophage sp.]
MPMAISVQIKQQSATAHTIVRWEYIISPY